MKRLFSTLIFLIVFAGVIFTQYLFDVQKSKRPFVEPIVFKPGVVRAADIGLHNAAGDIMWLASIQYFGGSDSRTYQKMPDYLNLTTDLDPKFPYPFAFGALILPAWGYTEEGINLAKKGLEKADPDWEIAYYLATTYWLNKNDEKNAAKYFDISANTPGAPARIQRIAANFGSRSDRREKTKQIWVGIYETSNDEVVKERAKNYILHIEIMDLVEKAAAQYNKTYKKYPANIDDLVTSKILNSIPKDPFGYTFKLDSEGKAVAE